MGGETTYYEHDDNWPDGSNAPTVGAAAQLRFMEMTWRIKPNLATTPLLKGFEMRDPLGDIRLCEFCLAVPYRLWNADAPRSFARRVLADRLPAQILHNYRRGRQTPEWFYRLNLRKEQVMMELEQLEHCDTASKVLDLPRMRRIAADWPSDATTAAGRFNDLIAIVSRGVGIGQFIRWVEDGDA
jgi:asparagine synthase (glutamine-hydrolysing)